MLRSDTISGVGRRCRCRCQTATQRHSGLLLLPSEEEEEEEEEERGLQTVSELSRPAAAGRRPITVSLPLSVCLSICLLAPPARLLCTASGAPPPPPCLEISRLAGSPGPSVTPALSAPPPNHPPPSQLSAAWPVSVCRRVPRGPTSPT